MLNKTFIQKQILGKFQKIQLINEKSSISSDFNMVEDLFIYRQSGNPSNTHSHWRRIIKPN